MNANALLMLIGELYGQVVAANEKITALEAALAAATAKAE